MDALNWSPPPIFSSKESMSHQSHQQRLCFQNSSKSMGVGVRGLVCFLFVYQASICFRNSPAILFWSVFFQKKSHRRTNKFIEQSSCSCNACLCTIDPFGIHCGAQTPLAKLILRNLGIKCPKSNCVWSCIVCVQMIENCNISSFFAAYFCESINRVFYLSSIRTNPPILINSTELACRCRGHMRERVSYWVSASTPMPPMGPPWPRRWQSGSCGSSPPSPCCPWDWSAARWTRMPHCPPNIFLVAFDHQVGNLTTCELSDPNVLYNEFVIRELVIRGLNY